MPNHIFVFLKPHLWAENDSKGSHEVIYQPGGLGECLETLVLNGLSGYGFRSLKLKINSEKTS